LLELLALEADLARREVRLRVGAMIAMIAVYLTGRLVVVVLFRQEDLELFGDLAGNFLGEFSKVDDEFTRRIFPFCFPTTSTLDFLRDNTV
jgi:hypothetical protein